MPKSVAAAICWAFIAGLVWLDRGKKSETSAAIWISFIWLGLAASRSASQWMSLGAPIDSGDLQLEGSPIDRIVYSALLAAGLIVLISRAKSARKLLWANLPVVVFFLYCALSLFWSDFPDVAFKRWLKAIGDLVMMLVIWTESDPTAAVRHLLKRVSYILIPLSVLLIKYYPEYGRTYGRWSGEVHYTGVTTNKNTLGAICMLFGLATLWRLLALYQNRREFGRKRMLVANAVVLAIALWLLSMAESMTSWSCFVMGSSLIVAQNFRFVARRRYVVHLIVIAMLLISVAVLFLGISPSTLSAMGRDPTLTTRTEMWPLLLSLCKNPIGGTGFGSFWLGPRLAQIWRVWEWKPNEAHNGYLEIYLNLGWIGLMLLAVVLVTGYRLVIKRCRVNRELGSLLLAYFVVGMAYNFTEAAFFQMLHPVWILLLLAMSGAAASASRKRLVSVNGALHRSRPECGDQPSFPETSEPIEVNV